MTYITFKLFILSVYAFLKYAVSLDFNCGQNHDTSQCPHKQRFESDNYIYIFFFSVIKKYILAYLSQKQYALQ